MAGGIGHLERDAHLGVETDLAGRPEIGRGAQVEPVDAALDSTSRPAWSIGRSRPSASVRPSAQRAQPSAPSRNRTTGTSRAGRPSAASRT